ncbi:MATE family efflux transporter [Gammaproteobacteria bacterium AH-315-E17]|nr:MATE family efflux transporter [Gammaproteobacteria bacterium AH-315-E17]
MLYRLLTGKTYSSAKPDLLHDPVGQVLYRTSVPITIGAIAMVLFYLADTWYVSQLGTQELTALGFTFPATIMVTYLGVGLAIGTSALIAKSIGANNKEKAVELTYAAVAFGYLFGLLTIYPALASITWVFTLMGASPPTVDLINDFLSVWYLGIPLILVQFAGTAVMRACGHSNLQGRLMMMGAATNFILDPLLIFGPGPLPAFGIKGAAIATVLTWVMTNIFIWYYLAVKEKMLKLIWPGFSKLTRDWVQLMKITLPAALANMITPLATGVITATLAAYGPSAVAGFGVVMRIEALVLIVVLGMSMSLPPFISQNFGAQAYDRLRHGLKLSLKFIIVLQFVLYLVVALAAPFIAAIFSSEQEVREVIITILRILPASYAFQGMVVLSASSFNALHAPRNALVASLLRFFVFYVPLALIGAALSGISGLFVGAAIGNLLAGLLITWWISRYTATLE